MPISDDMKEDKTVADTREGRIVVANVLWVWSIILSVIIVLVLLYCALAYFIIGELSTNSVDVSVNTDAPVDAPDRVAGRNDERATSQPSSNAESTKESPPLILLP